MALALVPAPVAAERPVGAVFYECQDQTHFTLPGRDGKPALFRNLTKPKTSFRPNPPGADGELLETAAQVEPDGSIAKLTMTWLQAGTMGWPYVARADLDDVYLSVRLGGVDPTRSYNKVKPLTHFDPERLFVEIEWRQLRPIRHPLMLELAPSRSDDFRGGGLAAIPPWRKSASIGVSWPDLRALAGNTGAVAFRVSDLSVGPEGSAQTLVRNGEVDLSIMPAVIAQFEEAERRVRAKAARRETECMKRTVAEPFDASVG